MHIYRHCHCIRSKSKTLVLSRLNFILLTSALVHTFHRESSRSNTYLISLKSWTLQYCRCVIVSNVTAYLTVYSDVSTRACIREGANRTRGKEKKKQINKKKKERKKALLVFKWRIMIVIRGVEHGVQRAS